jgi:hypothetical protein
MPLHHLPRGFGAEVVFTIENLAENGAVLPLLLLRPGDAAEPTWMVERQ